MELVTLLILSRRRQANITKEVTRIYVDLCETCALKKRKVRKSIVVKPIISNIMNSRCQVDLIDMQSQPDDDFKWMCVYQDHLTKLVILRPHKTKQAVEVAFTLQDIFCVFGSPNILQSDNGREFSNKVMEELVRMWPGCKIVHGKPRHSQSQVRSLCHLNLMHFHGSSREPNMKQKISRSRFYL